MAEDATAGRSGASAQRNFMAASEGGSSEDYPSDDEEALGMTTEPPEFYNPKADEKVCWLLPIYCTRMLYILLEHEHISSQHGDIRTRLFLLCAPCRTAPAATAWKTYMLCYGFLRLEVPVFGGHRMSNGYRKCGAVVVQMRC